jgi:hypothetical protein
MGYILLISSIDSERLSRKEHFYVDRSVRVAAAAK